MNAWHDTSQTLDKLSPALVAALGKLTDIPKGRTANAGSYAYRYADLSDLLGMARPILAEHGLGILQPVTADETDVLIFTTLLHESGQFITFAPLRMPLGKTAQNTGSSITFGRRYALLAALGLAAEDDDGQQASQRRPEPPRPTTHPPRTEEEAEVRRLVAQLSKPQRDMIAEAFLDEFGDPLRELPTSLHPAALEWTRQTIDALGNISEESSLTA